MSSYVAQGYWAEGYGPESPGVTLLGDGCEQRNTSTDGAIGQEHILAGDGCAQLNTCTSGGISIGAAPSGIILFGVDAEQRNTCTAGPIVQISIVADFWLQPGAGKTWQPPNPLRP